jgi:hypothetical protein
MTIETLATLVPEAESRSILKKNPAAVRRHPLAWERKNIESFLIEIV